MSIVEKVLSLARGEIGTKEKPMGSNNVKYNTEYYGGTVNNRSLAWCAVFVWWVFKEAGISDLYYGGGKTASCSTLYSYHKNRGQSISNGYKPGDIIFFNFSGGKQTVHVGICESFDGKNIVTIDGNTSASSQANGGTVNRRKRPISYIVAAYRPLYAEQEIEAVEEDIVSQEMFNEMMEEYLSEISKRPPSDWSLDAREWAESNNYIEGNKEGEKMYKKLATREEVIAMLFKILGRTTLRN